jgi:hypothetical protein
MKDPRTTETSQCVLCGGRLRNAVFCPTCGHSSCSWACYMRHLAQHSRPGWPASYPSDSRRDERPDQAGEQAVAC